MLPFHALLFRLRLIVEGSCFIKSDDSLQESLSFFVKPIKEFPGNVKAVLLVLRREHLRYLATATLEKLSTSHGLCDELYLWICPAARLFLQQLSSFQQESSRVLLVFFSGAFTFEGLPCLGSSLILVRPSLNLSIHTHISFVQTATPILGRHSSIDFTWFYTFCSEKSDHSSLFFMCPILQGSSHLKNDLG